MTVLVDTSVWSLALRRRHHRRQPALAELEELINAGDALLLGVVRQELLSGISSIEQFESLRLRLRAYPDLAIDEADHENAAGFLNRCRAKGLQGSPTDFLICAVAARRELRILTVDRDFARYSTLLPIELYPLTSP